MTSRFPLNPPHPERICWGCDKYCAAHDLQCGNGSGRCQHPCEIFGEDWYLQGDWGITTDQSEPATPSDDTP